MYVDFTASQQRDARDRAVQAVRHRHSDCEPFDAGEHWKADEDARRLVTDAVTRYGVPAEQIAFLAGVRQLAVAQFIEDDDASAEALVAARRAAEGYVREVMGVIRAAALARFYGGEQKTRICELLGITRPALDAWIRESEIEAYP